MGSLKEIRNRIKTVKNTRKITSAMSRIAAARLVKAQHAAIAARPYGERLEDVVYDLMAAADPAEGGALSPLMPRPARAGEVRRVALVLVTADRGLCGGFNANANRAARTFLAERKAQGYEVPVLTVGRKGKSYLSHERHAPFLQHHPSAELETVIARAKDVAHEAT
ncbi:MAG: F0F1 ATP synthase subunit gamma, partial [Nannocystaceae bacterium]